MFLTEELLYFDTLFTELKNLSSLSFYGTTKLVGFRKYIGKCMVFENMQIFILKKRSKIYLEGSRSVRKLKFGQKGDKVGLHKVYAAILKIFIFWPIMAA